jgi:predicted transcriptional regulator
VYAFSVEARVSVRSTIRPSEILEESLVRLAEKVMTDVQQQILKYILLREDHGDPKTYSWYVRTLSKDLGLPESTVKWSLKSLRDACLIEAGSAAEKGLPLRLTYPGMVVAGRVCGGEPRL